MKTKIIVLCHGQLSYTIFCIESIYRFTPIELFDLVVVDNNSTDGTADWLLYIKQKHNNCFVLNSDKNLGFAGGNNLAFNFIRNNNQDYDSILLINNDCIVSPNWLESMRKCLVHRDKIGIVGPTSNAVGGTQIIKLNLPISPDINFIGKVGDNIREKYKDIYTREGVITGTIMLLKKTCWEELGDLPSELLTFEDNYYCLLALHKGWKLYCDRSCFIFHAGSKTIGIENLNKVMFENRQKFIKIWSEKEKEL